MIEIMTRQTPTENTPTPSIQPEWEAQLNDGWTIHVLHRGQWFNVVRVAEDKPTEDKSA